MVEELESLRGGEVVVEGGEVVGEGSVNQIHFRQVPPNGIILAAVHSHLVYPDTPKCGNLFRIVGTTSFFIFAII